MPIYRPAFRRQGASRPTSAAPVRRHIRADTIERLAGRSPAAAAFVPLLLKPAGGLHPPSVMPAQPTLAVDEAAITDVYQWANAALAQGAYSWLAEGVSFMGYPLLAQLAQRPEYRRISEVIAMEMTRKWIRIHVSGDEERTDEVSKINIAAAKLNVRPVFRRSLEQDGFFGRSHIFIDLGTDDDDELKTPIGNGRDQISRNKVAKGSLKRLVNVEPVWCSPLRYNTTNPLTPNFYKPEAWLVQGREIHASRLLTLVSREVPDIFKPAYSFGGLALSQMAQPYINNWIRTRQSVSDLVHSFSVLGFKTDLGDVLMGGAGLQAYNRLELFNTMRDNKGVMLLDKLEELVSVVTPLGTLDKLQAQAQEQVCSVSAIPLVKYTGITPSGLNASSDGEIRVFYDTIHAQQDKILTDPLETILGFIQLSEFGDVDPEIVFGYEPLWSMSEETRATKRKTDADTASVLVAANILTREEVRQSIASEPETPYAGLEAEEVPTDTATALAAFTGGAIDQPTILQALLDSGAVPQITPEMIKEARQEPPDLGEMGGPGEAAGGEPGAGGANPVGASGGGAGGPPQRDRSATGDPTAGPSVTVIHSQPPRQRAANDKQFEESKHPRDAGKFASTAGAGVKVEGGEKDERSDEERTAAKSRVASWLGHATVSDALASVASTVKAKAKDPAVIKSVLATAMNQAIGHYVYTHDYMDSDVVAHAINNIEVGLGVTTLEAKSAMRKTVATLIAARKAVTGQDIAIDAMSSESKVEMRRTVAELIAARRAIVGDAAVADDEIMQALLALQEQLGEDDGIADDAFNESDHPRGSGEKGGQFVAKGSGGGGGAKSGGGKEGGESEGPRKGTASHLFHSAGGASKLTGAQIAERHGATEAVSKAEAKMAKAIPSDAPVAKGGHKLPNGDYTPERQALHEKLLDDVFTPEMLAAAMPEPGKKPVMTVLGGRGGSGKSWLTSKDGPVDAGKSIVVDADHFKGQLPGYEGWNAGAFHEESSHLVDRAQQRAIAAGVNVVHDATLKSYDGAAKRVADYQKAGYEVHGHYMFASPETATSRAMGRFVRGGETGRFVPPDVVLGNTANEANFDKLTPHFAKWSIHDNNEGSGGKPKLVSKSEDR